MGVFEFVIALILISSAAKIIERQRRSTPLPGESVRVDTEELRRWPPDGSAWAAGYSAPGASFFWSPMILSAGRP